jgi:signal transduction histidine kinase/ActR/RegA family two-component response regulator
MASDHEYRVVILPATRRDGVVASELLRRARIDCLAVADATALRRALDGPIGALVVADTALAEPAFARVTEALSGQPTWSDVPVVLMSRADEAAGHESVSAVVARLTNVTVIDRPASIRTLVSAVQAALRARRRQYEIRDQIAALSEAQEALRQSDRRKDEFLATLAHELRNPLAPLRSALQVMELRKPADPEQARLLAMMDRQMNVMVRLIDDLLDIARISSGKVTLRRQRLDLRKVIEAAAEAAMPAITAAGHRLHVSMPETPVPVMGDATRLAQVVGNLLNNATKYTGRGGELSLALATEADDATIAVRDNGAGIPPDVLKHVFDMFAQVNRTLDRAQGGLGIGLSLVRQLVEMHSGSVEASSAGVDQGSTFTVRLPRLSETDAESAERRGARPPTSAKGPRLSVLVVDDNRDAADTLALLLAAAGHEVHTAYDGVQALASAGALRPGVVFCDIGMPGMSGYEVAATLRADAANAGTTLVAVTGWGNDIDKRLAHEAGFDFHLTKPVHAGAIAGVLHRLPRRAAGA